MAYPLFKTYDDNRLQLKAKAYADQQRAVGTCGGCIHYVNGECDEKQDWMERPIRVHADSVACGSWSARPNHLVVVQ